MNIKIKCPVCQANNLLSPTSLQCRRCTADLSLLYTTMGYSLKYRLQLAQVLPRTDLLLKQNLAQVAASFVAVKKKK